MNWEQQRSEATKEIVALTPAGNNFILVDEDKWGIREFPKGRQGIPFPERAGKWWGLPTDDETAIQELERLRQAGTTYLVIAWPAFWWLDYYSEWGRHLVSRFRCLLANERVCLFDLLQPAAPGPEVEHLTRLIRAEGNYDAPPDRNYPPGDLRGFERRVYSEDGEDGILEEILDRLGTDTRYFVEFGVGSGRYCNCARLVFEEDWQGLFMEAAAESFDRLHKRYLSHPKVKCVEALVTPANIETLLATFQVPREFDVLSIDIDGNDYWVWAAIKQWGPRVVVIEYNSGFPPHQKWVMDKDAHRHWDGSNLCGASLASLASLGKEKGYVLVATDSKGFNAFFVRKDLFKNERFLDPAVYYHYSPPGHGPIQGGHPPGKV